MADGEAVGEAGLALLERLAAAPPEERRVRVPTVTDPRGVDLAACAWLRQPELAPPREARIVRALEALGVLLTNTCVPYQVVAPPVAGEHLAMGDTGSAIYANSVLGARTNFEGGVASAWMVQEMVVSERAPAALLLHAANPVLAQGAALAGLPLIDRFPLDVTAAIPDGALVEVEPATGTVRLLEG